MNLKIESNIPIPKGADSEATEKRCALMQTLATMQPGQSVFVPTSAFTSKDPINAAGSAVRRARLAADDGRKYSCRTVDGGIRIWRVV